MIDFRILSRPTVVACALLCWLGTSGAIASDPADQPTVIAVLGAPGEEEYGDEFGKAAERWEQACRKADAKFIGIGRSDAGGPSDYERLKQALADEPKESAAELWVVLIGHGTFDDKEAKFNLRGPDVSAEDCASWLRPFRRPVIFINCASSSGPFLNALSQSGRVIITATKSGHEQNYTRFGQYLSQALSDPEADLDKDGQTSLLEAFLTASHRVADFYKTEGRLATEHALLDDNGDGRGTPADWFRGVRAVKKAADGAAADGLRAHQFHLVRSERERGLSPSVRAKRDALELGVERLRESKADLPENEYYARLEKLLLELARLYHKPD